jgi:hypothetical protein
VRRKSKPRVVWLPPSNNSFFLNGGSSTIAFFVINASGGLGTGVTSETTVVADTTFGGGGIGAAQSLADIENTGYRIRRIVGKIFVFSDQFVTDGPKLYAVTAALMVRKTAPGTLGSLASAAGESEISPARAETQGHPWIWRRQWLVANNLSTVPGPFGGVLPPSNFAHGPALGDGQHVDAKTARLVGQGDRLYLNVNATIIVPGANAQTNGSLGIVSDLRVLASMRTSSGNRRDATR